MSLEDTLRKIVREELTLIVRAEFDRRKVGIKTEDEYMDSEQAASYIKVEPAWLRALVKDGRIAAHKAENSARWKFLKSDLDEYLTNGRREKGNVSPIPQKGSFFELNKKSHRMRRNAVLQ